MCLLSWGVSYCFFVGSEGETKGMTEVMDCEGGEICEGLEITEVEGNYRKRNNVTQT